MTSHHIRWAAALLAVLPGWALADTACRGGQSFESWLSGLQREVAAAGLSERAVAALDGVKLDRRVLDRDRSQPSLSQTFLEFADRTISSSRISRGRDQLARYADTFRRIEQKYGVQGPVLVACWGLETDCGAYRGDFDSIRALVSLTWDCRRSDHFKEELFDALRLLSDGDLTRNEMVGAWAGELGQVQFTPSNYRRYAIDFDGDGRRDLVSSVPDAMASAANFLHHLGWRPNDPWLEEVRLPETLPWDAAGRGRYRERSFWAGWGIARADGSPLPKDGVQAALVLPMGRSGPAFLAYRHFDIVWEWNNSSNYSLAAAYFATRLAGAPPMQRGGTQAALSPAELREVQERLNRMGFDAGPPDGRLGQKTRDGVRAAQLHFRLPPDGYPDAELLKRLRGS